MKKESTMKSRTFLITAGILAAGVVLGGLILVGAKPTATADEHGAKEAPHAEAGKAQGAGEAAKGPHGGRLLSQGDFAVEIAIFEQGVAPEYRAHAYEKTKPVAPTDVKLQVHLERLGAQPETIGFKAEKDFLRSDPRDRIKATSSGCHRCAKRPIRWRNERPDGRLFQGADTFIVAGTGSGQDHQALLCCGVCSIGGHFVARRRSHDQWSANPFCSPL
jgi:hypothetical protein